MPDTLPTGSVTGQQGWEWNRMATNRHPGAVSRNPQRAEPRSADHDRRPPGGVDRPSPTPEYQALVAELDRREARLQSVITRYERLLDEKNRTITETDDSPSPDLSTRLLARLRRLLARR